MEINGWDDKEISEREGAASALAKESPETLIDLLHDSIDLSEKAASEILYMWDELLDAYASKIDYSEKEDWQTKMTTGDLNSTVKQGTAVIRKALRQPNWYSIDPTGDEDKPWATFLRKALDIHLDRQHARFNSSFADACELGFAIGQGHEIIPRWIDGKGLELYNCSPFKIRRDPNASPRDPWSGDFWIHFEWLDYWKVKRLGDNPLYQRLDEVTVDASAWGKETREKESRRKRQYDKTSGFRKVVKVAEYWGVILDRQGELLLDNHHFTVAGDVLIRGPEPNPFVNLKWPGVTFSPIPDILSFEGHGIIESSLMLWLMTCNLMSLHADDLAWRVNKAWQIYVDKLMDPTQTQFKPGEPILVKGEPGHDVIKNIFTHSGTSETLATIQDWRQLRENNSFVNQFVVGLPGDRSKITKGEVEIKTGQSMTIFDSIGEDIEDGACNVLKAIIETLVLNWTEGATPSVSRVFPNDPYALQFGLMPSEARRELLKGNCDIKILGISAQIKQSELLPRIQWLMNIASKPPYDKFYWHDKLNKTGVAALGLYEPDFLKTENEVKATDIINEHIKQLAMRIEEAQKAGIPPEIALNPELGGNGGVGAPELAEGMPQGGVV